MLSQNDIFKKLTFGVSLKRKKVRRSSNELDLCEDDSDHTKSLRLRVLPENIDELEDSVEEESEDDEAVQIFERQEASSQNAKPVDTRAIQRKRKLVEEIRRLNAIYAWGDAISDCFVHWRELKVPCALLDNIKNYKIEEPSPIQMQAIPLMLANRDVLACAPTGSGKTLAFVVPCIATICRLKRMPKYSDGGKTLAIILEPTRELAQQTHRQLLKFSEGLQLSISLLDDEEEVKKADVIVGTPKRLLELLSSLKLKWLRWLIVDESDRLFDNVTNKKSGKGTTFREQLGAIYKACDGKWIRRAFFSATFSQEIEKWCKENIPSLVLVCIGERNIANSNVEQELVYTGSEQGKLTALKNLFLERFDPPALIFVQSKERGKQLESWFKTLTPPIANALISSDCSVSERDKAIECIRSGELLVLICTELVGRGLDFPTVGLVVNFDLPTTIVSYIHRIGRTGRAGRSGKAITYFTQSDFKYVRPIAHVIKQSGFDVPKYTLSLQAMNRKTKKDIYRHAIKRKNIAAPKTKHIREKSRPATRKSKANQSR